MGADPVYDQFLARLERVLQTRREAFEVPLLTRYAEGDRQLVHDDARRPGSKDFAAFMRHGGQREVCIVRVAGCMASGSGGWCGGVRCRVDMQEPQQPAEANSNTEASATVTELNGRTGRGAIVKTDPGRQRP